MFDIRMKIGPRLKSARQAKGWTFAETAARLSEINGAKVIPSRYGNWEMMINTPPLDQLLGLGRLFGKPAGYLGGLSDDDGTEPVDVRFTVPRISTVMGHQGTMNLGDDALALRLTFLDELDLSREHIMLVEAPDDSMTGVIEQGDRVLIDLSETQIKRDDLFAILVGDRLWVRWIRQELDGNFSVQAEVRERYKDQILNREELEKLNILGRVRLIAHIR